MLKTVIFIAAIIVIFIIINKVKNGGIMQVSVAEALTMVKDSSVTLLDVRTPAEFSQGHLKGATLIPVDALYDRLKEIAPLKERPILVYCHSGNRSLTASRILKSNGFTQVRNLQGGITAWMNGGNEIVKN